jgi:hypothetical protein
VADVVHLASGPCLASEAASDSVRVSKPGVIGRGHERMSTTNRFVIGPLPFHHPRRQVICCRLLGGSRPLTPKKERDGGGDASHRLEVWLWFGCTVPVVRVKALSYTPRSLRLAPWRSCGVDADNRAVEINATE